ncbi:MAG TPA: hypothetical protein ENN77_00040 [Candidatus Wirthbacteria bacterium]|nr:hypothetical protein [Candidatus Wirthbacteria bacterium]
MSLKSLLVPRSALRAKAQLGAVFLSWLLIVSPVLALARSATPLQKAVDKGDVSVQARGQGTYRTMKMDLTNNTNRNLSVDINGTFFTPPESSYSQRLGISHIDGSSGDSVVELGKNETKSIVASSFCIDSSKGIPGSGEDFTFGGHVKDLPERPYLNDILDWYRDNPDAPQYQVQDAVWSIESDHQGDNYHLNEAAQELLEQITGFANPLESKLELDEQKQDTADKTMVALGTLLSSIFGAGAIASLSGEPSGATQLVNILKGAGQGIWNLATHKNPNPELVQNLNVDNLTDTILGQGEDIFKVDGVDDKGNPVRVSTTLSNTWKNMTTVLGITNDANALHKDGYNDNILQSFGLSTMMNLGSSAAMDALDKMGSSNLGTIETFAKLFLPKSTHDVLPSSIFKQGIQSVGDVTKALAESLGSGDWEPLNQYAEQVADGKKGLWLKGYGQMGDAAGEIAATIEQKGVKQTVSDFVDDCKLIVETGALKDVIAEGANALADEAKNSTGADRGIAELSEAAGHIVGTLESKGVIDGTKELKDQFVDDMKVILEHGDANQIMNDVADSAEAATGIIGTGVKESAQLAGEYYEKGGGVLGAAKEFGKDVALIWKYLW